MKNRLRELILKKAKSEGRKVKEVRAEIKKMFGLETTALSELERASVKGYVKRFFKLRNYFGLSAIDELFETHPFKK